ncbi:MAG: hypothetical protein MI741_02520, partial [Rhodospirillales bacterium]|nr:hypothetical protein [Rhodospirillales bacterium]
MERDHHKLCCNHRVRLGAVVLCAVSVLAWADAPVKLDEIRQDLVTPAMTDDEPVRGKRVRQKLAGYVDTQVYHALYLPTDWQPGQRYPVIVEYPGNGPYRNKRGDVCTGKLEDCNLGYGISGGKGFIWVCLPFVSEDRQRNQLEWWGNAEATVEYCKATVALICEQYGGDREAVFITGFSRGSIACNYIGLYDDEIAKLWRGFICHSHYDGVRWNHKGRDGETALDRLKRLKNRPQFVSHEG